MARTRKTEPERPDGDATSPAIADIDPRQAKNAKLTSLPDEDDNRTDEDRPDPKDDPHGPNDVSNVVDPSDPMTLTGEDAKPGNSGQ